MKRKFDKIPVKVDSVGRVVIPKKIRLAMGIEEDEIIDATLENDKVLK